MPHGQHQQGLRTLQSTPRQDTVPVGHTLLPHSHDTFTTMGCVPVPPSLLHCAHVQAPLLYHIPAARLPDGSLPSCCTMHLSPSLAFLLHQAPVTPPASIIYTCTHTHTHTHPPCTVTMPQPLVQMQGEEPKDTICIVAKAMGQVGCLQPTGHQLNSSAVW